LLHRWELRHRIKIAAGFGENGECLEVGLRFDPQWIWTPWWQQMPIRLSVVITSDH
jgi:hypothetical protein